MSNNVTLSFDWHLIFNVIIALIAAQLLIYGLRWVLSKVKH